MIMDTWIFLFILFISSIVKSSVVQITYTSNGQYTFIVPNWVRSVNMILTGASGGTAYSGSGGYGAIVNTTLSVTPGATSYIFVGGAGTGISAPTSTPRAGGFNLKFMESPGTAPSAPMSPAPCQREKEF